LAREVRSSEDDATKKGKPILGDTCVWYCCNVLGREDSGSRKHGEIKEGWLGLFSTEAGGSALNNNRSSTEFTYVARLI